MINSNFKVGCAGSNIYLKNNTPHFQLCDGHLKVLFAKASDNMLTAGATAPAATEIAPAVNTTRPRKKKKNNIKIDGTAVHCIKRKALKPTYT